MEVDLKLLYISLSLFSLLFAFRFLLRSTKNLPPSPRFSLPIIGHLHLIKHPIHRGLHKLSEKYGHVFSLRFGSRLVVVISSPSVVEECFTKNDIVLANRPILNSGKYLTYDYTVFSDTPYGDHWRNLRRIGTIEIFSATRLNMFLESRGDEVKRLVRRLRSVSSNKFSKVELGSMFTEMVFNILMTMVAGKRFYGDDVSDGEQATQFKDIMRKIIEYGGASNIGDFIPIWNWIDPTGFDKTVMKLGQRADAFFQELLDEKRREKEQGRKTMIDHLLSLQEAQPENLSDQIIKGLILVILTGSDTSPVTLEWAMTHLLNNPDVFKKARTELDSVIGQERLVVESDLSKLNYIQGIISETLRLSPPAPLLLPHCTSEKCTIAGYEVPGNTMILINAWSIHRDPKLWEDAESFKPERHENAMDGESFKWIPFGRGRRACPGVGIAQRMIGLCLASLIQCFEWERVSDELVDMAEHVGVTTSKARRLEAMCRARPVMEKALFCS